MAEEKSGASASAKADALSVLEKLKADNKIMAKKDMKDEFKKAFKAKHKAKKGELKTEHKANKEEHKALKAMMGIVKSMGQSS